MPWVALSREASMLLRRRPTFGVLLCGVCKQFS
jgi:hypothetical protein